MDKMNKLKNLIGLLKTKKISLAAAESCSGGYLSYLLTKIPGSSMVFKGSVVTYSLEAKNKFFKIPFPLLKKTEGVSEDVAVLLAKGARKSFKASMGLSVVGFAGPGTQPGVNQGTVFFAVADKNGIIAKKAVIKGSRDYVRKKVSFMVIDLLYKRLCVYL
ncbi:MAG: CinA family protein [Candidatus Omnitrophota bacterium]|jgi:PncC family amidohydrolase